MMRRVIACCLVLGVLALAGSAVAQTTTLPPFPVNRVRPSPEKDLIKTARMTTTSYNFLKLATNARSAGMGDAYTAVGNDLSAVFYNPAGITQIEKWELVGGYTKWLVGSQIGTFALGVKTNVATLALSFVNFMTEEFEETTSGNPGGTGRMVRGSDMALGLTIAKQVTDKLSVGGNIRWVQEDLDLVKYANVDIDFGTLFYTGFKSTRIGMTLKNLGGDKDVVVQKARFPMTFNLSGAMEVYGNLGDPVSVTVAAEQVFYTDYANRYHIGMEAWVNNRLALRAGYKTGYDSESWSVGGGLKQKLGGQTVKIDFSYHRAEALNENPLRLALGLAF